MIGNIKHIIVIESLEKKDGIIFTGESLYNDVIKRRIDLYEKDFKHNFHKVKSKEELYELMTYYEVNSEYLNGGIVFHFEVHGDENLKGLILSSGEIIEWKEISDLLRPINITTCNKVFLTLGICNGRFLYKGVDPYDKSPYSGFISASIVVDGEEIYISFSKLYEVLIENGNIVAAYTEMEKMKTNFYYKDSKRVFDDSFKDIMEQMSNDSDLKKDILLDAIKQTEKEKNTKLTASESDIIFNRALKDIYLKQLKAFDFKDCE